MCIFYNFWHVHRSVCYISAFVHLKQLLCILSDLCICMSGCWCRKLASCDERVGLGVQSYLSDSCCIHVRMK
jgi:hypothetical protein